MDYYVRESRTGSVRGPVSQYEVQRGLEDGLWDPSDLVTSAPSGSAPVLGSAEWLPMSSFPTIGQGGTDTAAVRGALAPRAAEDQKRIIAEFAQMAAAMKVTTADLPQPYEALAPVYFQVSNKGVFSSAYSKLVKAHGEMLANRAAAGQVSAFRADWDFLFGEWSAGQNDFEKAFYIAVEELKRRALLVGGNANRRPTPGHRFGHEWLPVLLSSGLRDCRQASRMTAKLTRSIIRLDRG